MDRTESPETEKEPRIVDVGFELLVRGSTQIGTLPDHEAKSEAVSGDV
jgi:hypothetical protein